MGNTAIDEQTFNVGEEEQEASVEMNEDGSEATVSEEPKGLAPKGPDLEELGEYGGKVKKRIDKLTARLRETQRREEAAIDYARSVQQQNEELQKRTVSLDGERRKEALSRADAHTIALKQVIKRAREEGDIDTETEAQQRLTQMLFDKGRMSAEPVRTAAPSPQPEILRKRAPEPDIKAEEWADENPWFGTNTVMTGAVRGIHMDLVQKEGFDPRSDEYYDEINRRMRSFFPKEFGEKAPTQQDNRSSRPVQTVAPATRSSGVNNTARRTVRLSPSQVAIAKKLGVPLEEYAKYVKD